MSNFATIILHKSVKMNHGHKLLTFTFMVVAFAQVSASTYSHKAARERAISYLNNRIQLEETPVMTAHKADGQTASYYVFNSRYDKGFVVVSADERAEVLAYTDQGRFDADNMPEPMREWLDALAGEAYHNADASLSEHEDVEPLIATSWAQDDPYNILCPTRTGIRCHTGCIATALAQIMYYYQWPEKESSEIPDYTPVYDNYGDFCYDPLLPVKFKWDLMKPAYSDSERGEAVDAVAQLMQYCGYASEMQYNRAQLQSETEDAYIIYTLKTYFQYSPAMQFIYQSDFSYRGWIDRIYEELAAKRPVVLTGREEEDFTSRGHAFICDGYKDGMLHINWGYGAQWNGYYKPYSFKESDWDYSRLQKAVVNIMPDVNDDIEPCIPTPVCTKIYDEVAVGIQCISFETYQFSFDPISFSVGYGNLDTTTGEVEFITARSGYAPTTLPTYNTSSKTYTYGSRIRMPVKNLKLQNGKTYNIVPLYCLTTKDAPVDDPSADWKPLTPYKSYLEVTVDQNGGMTYQLKQPESILRVDSITFSGDLWLEQQASMKVSITNIGEGKYDNVTTAVILKPLNGGRERTIGQSRLTIMPGESINCFNYTFTPHTSGDHLMYIKNTLTDEVYGSVNVYIIDPEGIDDVDCETREPQTVYTLTGTKAVNTSKKGIYVSKGKKIVR